MKYDDARKLGTQGELTVTKVCDPYYTHELSSVDEDGTEHHVAKVRGYFMSGGGEDAALLAHEHNNFMEALEALREAKDVIEIAFAHDEDSSDVFGIQHNNATDTLIKIEGLIERMEEVEGI